MEQKPISEANVNTVVKCPHCTCCFCTETDLKLHIEIYGADTPAHLEKFRRVHGGLEHSSFGGPE